MMPPPTHLIDRHWEEKHADSRNLESTLMHTPQTLSCTAAAAFLTHDFGKKRAHVMQNEGSS